MRKPSSFSPAVSVAVVLLAALLSLGIGGCLQTEDQRKAELRKRAEEILPAGARIRVLGYGDCVELAASPSCAGVVFEMTERDSGRRAALVRAEARGNGWTVTHTDDAAGGWSVFLSRGEFTAVVFLWRLEAYDVDCNRQPDPNSDSEKYCFNTMSVTR